MVTAVTGGNFTTVTVQNCDNWNGSTFVRIGNITYIKISVKNLTPNTNTTIAYLPTNAAPVLDVEFDGFGGAAYLNNAHFKITSAGTVTVYSADAYAVGWTSYPAQ